ncbi:MAG: DUF3179 domain-containing protein [Chloroflexi bacterium]|nr:DUF3179 domain-containing protein [Chloroflexota bacterium]
MRSLFRLAPVTLIIAVGAGVLFATSVPHSEASPDHQRIQCGDETIPVSTSILDTWPNTDFCKYDIDYTEVISGGPARDGITPIYPEDYVYPENIVNLGGRPAAFIPQYQTIDDGNEWLPDQSPVIAVEINGDARAYPLGVLTRHEIANTTIGGVPVAVTFCPLCNAGITFERVIDGQEYHFGVSGFLRNSDLIMWDHETESWWQQATGTAIVGELTGTQLEIVTSSMVSWADFKAAFPDGQVFIAVSADSGEPVRNYDQNPYAGYDSSSQPFLFRGEIDERLPATERVLGYENAETAIAYPFNILSERIVINDTVNDQPVVVFWQPGARSALDQSTISESREVGAANIFDPTLEDGTILTFVADDQTIRDEATGSTWNIFGEAIEGELEGTQLRQLRSVSHFWFAWSAFQPETQIWEASAE